MVGLHRSLALHRPGPARQGAVRRRCGRGRGHRAGCSTSAPTTVTSPASPSRPGPRPSSRSTPTTSSSIASIATCGARASGASCRWCSTCPTRHRGSVGGSRERLPFVERVRPDLVLCLAVVHHLALTNTVPLDEIVDFLADFGAPLVVEFPHHDDVMASRLLARKRSGVFDAYNRDNWEATRCDRRFTVLDSRERSPAAPHAVPAARPELTDVTSPGAASTSVAVAGDLVQRHLVAPGRRRGRRRSPVNAQPSPLRPVPADDTGDRPVHRDEQLGRLRRSRPSPSRRARTAARRHRSAGRRTGRPGRTWHATRWGRRSASSSTAVPTRSPLSPDRGQRHPVVTVREVLRAPLGDGDHGVDVGGRPSARCGRRCRRRASGRRTPSRRSASRRSTIDGRTSRFWALSSRISPSI